MNSEQQPGTEAIDADDVETAGEAQDTVEPMSSDEPEHIHEVIRKGSAGLFIGDFTASQDFDMLQELGVSVLIPAMRQRYDAPEGFELHRVLIDDDSRTNVMAHFPRVNDIIHESLEAGKGVLVHCQAGVSRSATLCAAFLMHEYGLTADEAIERISAVRSVIEPTEFFLHQLEMYERMECEIDPAKYVEYRRFLMAFSHADFMGGDGESARLYLAYYPSPAPTPRARSPSDPFRSLHMTPVDGKNGFVPRRGSSSSVSRKGSFGPGLGDLRMTSTERVPATEFRERRRSSTSRDISQNFRRPSQAELQSWREERRPSEVQREMLASQRESLKEEGRRVAEGKERLLKIGAGRVQVKGRRLRCKMCNRELAAREHVVDHDPGSGQQAFAIHRRDMTQHRQDEQKRKEDAKRRAERRTEQAVAKAASSPPSSDGKRTSLQDRLPNVAGLRVAMPPPFAPPVSSSAMAISASAEASSAIDLTDTPQHETPEPSPPLLSTSTCSSYFTEPLSWMQGLLEAGDLGGRIVCPNAKCGAKLGSFDWAGVQCSCGAWVVPGFALHTSKVDEIAH